jgi:hypothetical protein
MRVIFNEHDIAVLLPFASVRLCVIPVSLINPCEMAGKKNSRKGAKTQRVLTDRSLANSRALSDLPIAAAIALARYPGKKSGMQEERNAGKTLRTLKFVS